MAEFPRPRAVLFDWDSTLVDNWPGVTGAMNAALTAFGLETWTEAEMRLRAKRSMRDNFPQIFGPRWEEAKDIFYDSFRAGHIEGLRPLDGAHDLLRTLEAQTITMGVVSNKNGDFLRAEADALGWNSFFHRIVGATDARRDKPARDPVDLALEGSGHTAGAEIWFVGDSLVDLQCGIESGCTAILIGEDPISASDLEKWPPTIHFPDCVAMRRALID